VAQPVVDASPLIVLAKAGMLSLLRLAGDPVLVPLVVIQAVQQAGSNDPAVQALTATSWLMSVDPGPVSPILSPYQLDAGEASVLTWALSHPGTEVIVDETRARRCAAQLEPENRPQLGKTCCLSELRPLIFLLIFLRSVSCCQLNRSNHGDEFSKSDAS